MTPVEYVEESIRASAREGTAYLLPNLDVLDAVRMKCDDIHVYRIQHTLEDGITLAEGWVILPSGLRRRWAVTTPLYTPPELCV